MGERRGERSGGRGEVQDAERGEKSPKVFYLAEFETISFRVDHLR